MTARARTAIWLTVTLGCLTCSAPLPAQQEEPSRDTFATDYTHVVYNVGSNRPVRIFGGKVALDLRTPERWAQVLGELAELGINVTTPLTSYGPATIYPTKLPELKHLPGWEQEGLDGLKMLLDVCDDLGIECYPAVWLFRAATPELSAAAQKELVDVYGSHPAFKGLVPPVEANPGMGMVSEDFVDIAAQARELVPGGTIMDYPNGPFAPEIIQTIIARSLSGNVDVENVQFHPSDSRWDGDFLFARGLHHFVIGICPGVRSIVHTHYKYGGGKRWIELDDLYRTHQAATITATPHGTSIYSFLHAMWGEASSHNLDDPMPRRLAWYKGIVNSQRMAPYLAGARPANAVGIMIPRYTRESYTALLRRTYVPLAEAGIGAHFFVNEANMGQGVRAVIVPGVRDCSREQVRLLEGFVRDGGHLCALQPTAGASPGNYTQRAERVLGATLSHAWEPSGVAADFAAALGLDDQTGEVTVPEVVSTTVDDGSVLAMPPASAEEAVVAWTRATVPHRVIAERLGADFTLDRWRKTDEHTDIDMVMLMGTRQGATYRNVRLTIPSPVEPERAFLLTPDAIRELDTVPGDGETRVIIPRLCDEFNAVILSRKARPFLVPTRRLIPCRTGETVPVQAHMLNALDARLAATARLHPPEGWPITTDPTWRIGLAPGARAETTWQLTVPAGVVRRPHFARIECAGLVQRVILFPEDGEPQRFSDMSPAEVAEVAPKPGARRVIPKIGGEWLEVAADAPNAQNVAAHRPGVCFLPGREWDPPAEHEGRTARYGERLPRVAAPNFLINEPPEGDVEVRLTYWTQQPGVMHVYDGKRYHRVADLAETGRWATASGRITAEHLMATDADRPNHPGYNVMLDVDCPAVWVHKIEVRAADQPEE